MTEIEINMAVAKKLGLAYEVTRYGVVTRMSNKEQWREFDPCNNVEQAWEIMMKYNIGVVKNHTEDSWVAISANGEHEHSKPLVAAMLCFLEM